MDLETTSKRIALDARVHSSSWVIADDKPWKYTIGSRNGTGPSGSESSSPGLVRDTIRIPTLGAAAQMVLVAANSTAMHIKPVFIFRHVSRVIFFPAIRAFVFCTNSLRLGLFEAHQLRCRSTWLSHKIASLACTNLQGILDYVVVAGLEGFLFGVS